MRNMRFNLLIAAFGFILTFITSSLNNLYMTSLIRSLLAFVIWFVLAFVFRWVLGLMTSHADNELQRQIEVEQSNDQRGTRFDLTLPNDSEELNDLLTPRPESSVESDTGFTPLNLPKLVSAQDPEQLAKAVRHLTEK
ncbi:hypothetical protein PBAT_14215 [Paenibacillus antarcticus]|uniref:Uncharacterized protein n=2 Tax=Paenibacillus antarcticus TaxID=253703 RepID=A0A168MV85_9BACL|nr:hypothetical protein [Paenibacillus antarcticus]OAB45090.1 hypothetical protein PBAT_14215 [Paenibacillus antarcticus]